MIFHYHLVQINTALRPVNNIFQNYCHLLTEMDFMHINLNKFNRKA